MMIDEAIKHCREKADCTLCGQEHEQLAGWLEELKQRRRMRAAEEIAMIMQLYIGCDNCPITKCQQNGLDCYEIWLAWLNGEIEV